MIRPICKDVMFLSQKAVPATKEDINVGKDLLDTLVANKDRCVGMAANMIGVNKAIIVVNMGFYNLVMYNPKIIKKSNVYSTSEGCLSLLGERSTKRYEKIEVEYQDERFDKKTLSLSGFIAQIVQHEVDHLSGIII